MCTLPEVKIIQLKLALQKNNQKKRPMRERTRGREVPGGMSVARLNVTVTAQSQHSHSTVTVSTTAQSQHSHSTEANTYPRNHKECESGQDLEVGGGPVNQRRPAWRRRLREGNGAGMTHPCMTHPCILVHCMPHRRGKRRQETAPSNKSTWPCGEERATAPSWKFKSR